MTVIRSSLLSVKAAAEPLLDLHSMPAPPPWTDDALCAQVDNDLFFPEKGGSPQGAKNVCGQCPVRSQCLRYALENNEAFGIWGGLSARERRRITRQQDRGGAA
jgi:hypothetical protein